VPVMQIPALMGMLRPGERGQQEAAVAALASLADGNALVSAAIAAVSGSVPALQSLLRDRDPGIRLLAAACLVQLLRYEHVAVNNQVGPRTLSPHAAQAPTMHTPNVEALRLLHRLRHRAACQQILCSCRSSVFALLCRRCPGRC
jgi:hypothetical protein